jgi:hypothetical protein
MAGRECQELSGGGASLAAAKGDPERSLAMVAYGWKKSERDGDESKREIDKPPY